MQPQRATRARRRPCARRQPRRSRRELRGQPAAGPRLGVPAGLTLELEHTGLPRSEQGGECYFKHGFPSPGAREPSRRPSRGHGPLGNNPNICPTCLFRFPYACARLPPLAAFPPHQLQPGSLQRKLPSGKGNCGPLLLLAGDGNHSAENEFKKRGKPRRWTESNTQRSMGTDGRREMSTTSISKQAQGAKGFAIADLVPSAFCASHCNGKVCWKHNLKAFGIFFFFFFW